MGMDVSYDTVQVMFSLAESNLRRIKATFKFVLDVRRSPVLCHTLATLETEHYSLRAAPLDIEP